MNKQTSRFLDCYLDPLNSIDDIARLCGLKKSTVYNYEKELDLPKLKVGFGTVRSNLPKERVFDLIDDCDELYELHLIQQLGRELNARIKIIPTPPYPYNSYSPIQLIETKQVDFLISNYTKTKALTKKFYCSSEYFLEGGGPSGVLYCNPQYEMQRHIKKNEKPILAVLENGIHAEYAIENLQHEFVVRIVKSSNGAYAALQCGTVDYALFHESWIRFFCDEPERLRICSKPIFYRTNSTIVFHNESQHLVSSVNSAIDKILSQSAQKLNRK